MSLISRFRARLACALALSACFGPLAAVPGCAAFGMGGPSTVAQGKYYSSGNPQYDEFFIELYQLQVEMADAPHVPDTERQNLAQALGLSLETPADAVTQRLREEALKLGRSGVHMKLEQSPSPDKPEAATATIVATYRPKDAASAGLLTKVEGATTNLLRSVSAMKAAEVQLGKLEVQTISLDADVPTAFAEAHVGKRGEVKDNLADAQKLITLMKARGDDVSAQSEQLLAAVAQAVNTDDGSLSAPPAEAPEPAKPEGNPKKAEPKPHAKPKAVSAAPAQGAPATAPKPKPTSSKPAAGDDDAPAAPKPAPSKPAAAPRDFEP
jgi:hypothetical protein